MTKDLNKLKDYCSNFTRDLTDSQKDLINDFIAEEELRQHYELDSDINSINDLLNIHSKLQNFLPPLRLDYFRKRLEALKLILLILNAEEPEPKDLYFFYLNEAMIIAGDYFEESLSVKEEGYF